MEALREGIGLRGYGQKDPKQEYKKEGFVIFGEMMDNIGRNVCEKLFHVQVQRDERRRRSRRAPPSQAADLGRCRAPAPRRKTIESGGGAEPRGPSGERRRQRRRAQPSRSVAASPRWAATIPAPAEAAKSTRNATAHVATT